MPSCETSSDSPPCPPPPQANELLLSGRKLTAQEACSKGLVSQVLWPGTFTQEVMLRIKELVAVDPQVGVAHTSRTEAGTGPTIMDLES